MSMAAPPGFRRLVLAVGHGEAVPATEYAAMAAGLRRSLAALGTSLGIAQMLEVQRGEAETCLAGLCGAGDIIVLVEDAADRPRPHPGARLRAAALRSAALVLLLPAALTSPMAAPVAAVLAGPDDPSLAVAAGIAVDSGAALLVVLQAGDAAAVARHAARLGLSAARLGIRPAAGRTLAAIGTALGTTRERLLVLDHVAWGDAPGDGDGLPAALSRARGVPVLMIETRASRPA